MRKCYTWERTLLTELELLSPAKVNLTLDVLAKRPEDGYHYVRTTMIPISLADRVHLRSAATITVTSTPEIPGPPEQNLAYRAAQLLKEYTGYCGGAAIHITKVIPVAGGLAGGSSNGAAVLTGLNRLWGTGLAETTLLQLAIRLGSDVPFFVPARPALVEGIGERLTPLETPRQLWMVLAVPAVAKSTGNVYKLFDELAAVEHPNTEGMIRALAVGAPEAIGAHLGNVFEPVMLPRHPEIEAVKRSMLEHGAIGAVMSGAGPTVLGIVPDEQTGRRLQGVLAGQVTRTFLVSTLTVQGA